MLGTDKSYREEKELGLEIRDNCNSVLEMRLEGNIEEIKGYYKINNNDRMFMFGVSNTQDAIVLGFNIDDAKLLRDKLDQMIKLIEE